MKRITAVALTGTLALGGVALAACSSSSSTPAETTAATAAATEAAPTEAIVGDNPGTWTPLDITQSANGTTVDMVVDQVATFSDLPMDAAIVVESSDPSIVEASQAEGTGEVTASAAVIAKAPGTATITVKFAGEADDSDDQGGASNVIIQFEVNVAAQ